MQKILIFGLAITWMLPGMAQPITDTYVKNLTLVGVIHVEGSRAKGQSVAVVRDNQNNKTLLLHKGDSIAEAHIEVKELGHQQITLLRGGQAFVLRVEAPVLTASTYTSSEESENQETAELESPAEVVITEVASSETGLPASLDRSRSADTSSKVPLPRFEPSVIHEEVCLGENSCPSELE